MTNISPVVTLSPRDYDAVLFDLDGVLTKTATCMRRHGNGCSMSFFNGGLRKPAKPSSRLTSETDYRRYVDGKPRYDGVASFLKSRGIELPFASPEEDPGHTVQCRRSET